MSSEVKKKSFVDRFMAKVESAANKLPSPFTLFFSLFVFTAVLSLIFTLMGTELLHPATGEYVKPNNFFSLAGLTWILKGLVTNFSGYAPLGTVLVMTLGIGLCEEVGMVSSLIRKSMAKVPPSLVPYVVAFIGCLGNMASDSAAVIIPPLAALAFVGVGKHPIAGMVCGFAGTNAGWSANLMIASTDALAAGITNSVLDGFLGEGVYNVEVVCNYFFFATSCFVVSIVIGLVSTHIVEPRLGKYEGDAIDHDPNLSPEEAKALSKTGWVALAYVALIAFGYFSGPLSNNGELLGSLLLSGLIPILLGLFAVCGLTYGISIGYIKSEKDIPKALNKRIAVMSSYIVFVFMSAQFVALFSWTNLGTLLAIAGADFLESIGFTGLPMLIMFILLVAFINILMSSSSAKWTILAPIFVPMFLLLGYDPAYTQLAYRIGDSATNIVSPMSAYLFMMLTLAQEKYDPDAQLGTLISNLLPHSMCVLFVWIIMFILWSLAGIPIGPGAGSVLPAEIAQLVGAIAG